MSYWGGIVSKILRPLKYCCALNPEILPETTDPEWEFDYIDIGSVSLSEGIFKKERLRFGSAPSRARKLVKTGDILVSTVRTYLKAIAAVEQSDVPQVASTGFAVLRANHLSEPRYLFRVVQSKPFIDQVMAHSVGVSYPAINPGILANIKIPLPDLATQRRIADFLDRETARIDRAIEKKQRLAELLGELIQAIVSRMVKGSGSSEKSIRLRYVVQLNPSARSLHLEPDALVTFCPMEAIHDGLGGMDATNVRPLREVLHASYNFFAENDILLAKVTPCFENGKKAIARNLANGVGFATSEVFVIRPDLRRVHPEYLLYLFLSDDFQQAGRSSMTGASGLRRISESAILDFSLHVTGLCEQKSIAQKINNEVGKFKTILDATGVSITRLKEYRAALITAAVTGQIDVEEHARSGATERGLDAIEEEAGA